MKYLSERLPELWVEDGVDDGVEERVNVAQPCSQDEDGDSGVEGEADLIADGAED